MQKNFEDSLRAFRASLSFSRLGQRLYHSQSKVNCKDYLRLWQPKHLRISFTYRQWHLKLDRRGRKPKHPKKPKVMYLVGLVRGFLGAESKITRIL